MSTTDWQRYLLPGETLLWEGAPVRGVLHRPMIFVTALFGLPFLVVGLGLIVHGASELFAARRVWDVVLRLGLAAFGVPFAAIGAGLVFGLWYMSATAHRKVRYALTNRCAYVAKAYWNRSIETYPIRPESTIELIKGKQADTLWFQVFSDRDSDGTVSVKRCGFENIADGDDVYLLLRRIMSGEA
ncbi:MAG: hypothetical protein WBO29_15755 [Albidovulum sp.]